MMPRGGPAFVGQLLDTMGIQISCDRDQAALLTSDQTWPTLVDLQHALAVRQQRVAKATVLEIRP
jgi:hypothetical protein